jgi:hypothetical protein
MVANSVCCEIDLLNYILVGFENLIAVSTKTGVFRNQRNVVCNAHVKYFRETCYHGHGVGNSILSKACTYLPGYGASYRRTGPVLECCKFEVLGYPCFVLVSVTQESSCRSFSYIFSLQRLKERL